ncbi:MAG TPA: tubulin-like doman-containing protein [Fimbriimonadaceae bacterium]|nr:tubulin-like doman-containing protein [Fimbriimonadaceae bacterium]HRJ97357.1 tubulin-like doman-containing protein [Fimbriimonadaceae bacterium]
MAQRTLIIGIGSTGMAICEDVLQRIVDEFGSLDRVPWIKAVAFETARVTSAIGLMRDRTHSIGIASDEYSALVQNPARFDDMAFDEWQDPAVLAMANGSTDGAGNVRMIGRVSWMYRPNLMKFEGEIKRLLDELQSLTEQGAAEALGKTPYEERPTVRFDRDASNQSRVDIFVCGTLTGGTCSGCFVDVGYFLRTWPGLSGVIGNVIGLFGIPHVSYPIDNQTANAYAALMELNHFYHRGSVYDVKYATRPEQTHAKGMGPYNSVFLCHPPSGVAGAERSLNWSFGQFIYLSAMSQMGDQVRAKLINPSVVSAGTPDKQGNPMSFASLGVSAIEYPAEHIMKACTYHLAAAAIELWKGNQGIEAGPANLFLTSPAAAGSGPMPELGKERIRAELKKPSENKPSFSEIVAEQVARGKAAGIAGSMPDVAAAEATLESGFDHTVRPDSPIARLFIDGITANGDRIVDDRIARVEALFRDRISDADSGPAWCRDMATHMIAYCTEWLNQMQSAQGADPLADLRMNMERARARLEECHTAVSLMLGWRGTALSVCAQEYEDAATEYYEARLNLACEPYEARICSHVIEFCTRIKERIAHEFYGISRWSEMLHDELEGKYRLYNERAPEINGELLYDALTTADRDYERTLATIEHDGGQDVSPAMRGSEFVKRRLIRGWKWIGDQLLAPQDESYFDRPITAAEQNQPRPARREDLDRLTALGRGWFEPLMQISALERLYARQDPALVVDEVWRKCSSFLDVSDNRNPAIRGPVGRGSLHLPTFAFFKGAKGPAEGTNAHRLRSQLEPKVAYFEELIEPHRIVFLQARSTFSLSMIAGFNPDIDSTFRSHYFDRTRTDNRTYHSRSGKTVRWRPLDGPFAFPDRGIVIGRILVGIALGAIKGAGASPFRFDFNPLHPGEPGGPIELPHDLDDAAHKLSEFKSANIALKNDLDMRFAKESVDEIARRLDSFKNDVAKFQLTEAGVAIGPKDAYQLMLAFVGSVPGLLQAWKAFYPEMPSIDDYLRREGDTLMHGYYCPSPGCGAYLANESQRGEVPKRCPACGVILLLDD